MTIERRHPRKSIDVDLHGRDGEASGLLLFNTKDLSPGGAFIKSELLYEQGEELSLEFTLPGDPSALKVKARVAWVNRFPRDGQEAGMGVEFVALSAEDRARLDRFFAA